MNLETEDLLSQRWKVLCKSFLIAIFDLFIISEIWKNNETNLSKMARIIDILNQQLEMMKFKDF